jgi:hypothetical protein
MPIKVTCECGKRFQANDEYEGRRAICPSCRREFVFQRPGTPVFHEVTEPPPFPAIRTEEDEEPERGDSTQVRQPFWKDPIIVIGAAVPLLILVGFTVYLAWPSTTARKSTSAPIPNGAEASGHAIPVRNPKIPVELSYPVIEEAISPKSVWPSLPARRHISVRLNMKVSEEVLREIALELKAKETRQYESTRISFFLPGKGSGMGPGNTNFWATADFDSGLRVWIMGFTIVEERFLRTAPLSLPTGSVPIGTWLMDDGYAKARKTIYERQHRWFYHLQFAGTDVPSWIEMDELPADTGRAFKMHAGSDRYVVLPNGNLDLYNGEGKLLNHLSPMVPPPPAN